MSNNSKALLSGMGQLNKVAEAWQDQHEQSAVFVETIQEAWTALAELLDNKLSQRAGIALACSVLNRHYRDGSTLYSVNSDCKIGFDVDLSDDKRASFADILGI